MNKDDFRWFDTKYQNGQKPSLEDKAELFRQLDISIPDRTKRKIEEYIQQGIFALERRGYSAGLDAVIHGLLFCYAPIIQMDRNKYSGYVEQYKKVIQRYNGERKLRFQSNFED